MNYYTKGVTLEDQRGELVRIYGERKVEEAEEWLREHQYDMRDEWDRHNP